MQSKNEFQEIVSSVPVDTNLADDLISKIKAAEEKGATSHTIGKLPKRGETITINNLSFRVEFADYVKGKFKVKLVLK